MEAGTSKRCALVGSFFDLPHIEPLPHPKAAAVLFLFARYTPNWKRRERSGPGDRPETAQL